MKSPRQVESERTKRRANIRRGMKIALYEVQQVLAEYGVKLEISRNFIPYTVAIAEGGRRGASPQDRSESWQWQLIRAIGEQTDGLASAFGPSMVIIIRRR